jgi:branched-chain amino acid transport system ATP-binding protein
MDNTPSTAALLTLSKLNVHYGSLPAVHGLSLQVLAGQVVALLGANGAGKTTTLRAVMGLLPATTGAISFDGRSLAGLPPEQRVRLGLALVPEGRKLFNSLTVEENLRAGAYVRRDRRRVNEDLERIYSFFPDLRERRTLPAASLSGGQGQMLAIGRALMAAPRLLLLDEPSHGLAPRLVDQLFTLIARLNREHGMAVLLVEQNAARALELAEYGYILQHGQLALEGSSTELRRSEAVRMLYLGG